MRTTTDCNSLFQSGHESRRQHLSENLTDGNKAYQGGSNGCCVEKQDEN